MGSFGPVLSPVGSTVHSERLVLCFAFLESFVKIGAPVQELSRLKEANLLQNRRVLLDETPEETIEYTIQHPALTIDVSNDHREPRTHRSTRKHRQAL